MAASGATRDRLRGGSHDRRHPTDAVPADTVPADVVLIDTVPTYGILADGRLTRFRERREPHQLVRRAGRSANRSRRAIERELPGAGPEVLDGKVVTEQVVAIVALRSDAIGVRASGEARRRGGASANANGKG